MQRQNVTQAHQERFGIQGLGGRLQVDLCFAPSLDCLGAHSPTKGDEASLGALEMTQGKPDLTCEILIAVRFGQILGQRLQPFDKFRVSGGKLVSQKGRFGAAFDRFLLYEPDAMPRVSAVAPGPQRNLFVFYQDATANGNQGGHKIRIIDREGRFVRQILPFPADLPVGGNKVYVADRKNRRVAVVRLTHRVERTRWIP